MRTPSTPARKKGFTLIELLTVIAIIGILAGLLVPGVMMAKKIAQKAASGNNCGQIAKAYSIYADSGSNPRNISQDQVANSGGSVTGWAVYLAGKANFNNADMWFIKQDPALDAVQNYPQQVADLITNPAKPTAQSDFAAAKPKSWAVVVNASKSPTDRTAYPIVWTRGLDKSAGTWKKDAPWGAEGGHVGFLDGHSVSLENTKGDDDKGVFTDQKTGKPTPDITQAIKSSASSTADVLEDTI